MHGFDLSQIGWLFDLIFHPAILNAARAILQVDELVVVPLLVRGKAPYSMVQHVPWHQDIAYTRNLFSDVSAHPYLFQDEDLEKLAAVTANSLNFFIPLFGIGSEGGVIRYSNPLILTPTTEHE